MCNFYHRNPALWRWALCCAVALAVYVGAFVLIDTLLGLRAVLLVSVILLSVLLARAFCMIWGLWLRLRGALRYIEALQDHIDYLENQGAAAPRPRPPNPRPAPGEAGGIG